MAWRRETQPAMFPNDSTAMITHDFPLRPNLTVRLVLPVGLTTTDAARLATFINTLAFDPAEVPRNEPETRTRPL
jgi:hypothetical protein